MTTYDPTNEFENLDVPDADLDSKMKAMGRFRKLVDVVPAPTATASGSPEARFGAKVSERLRRDVAGDRKAGIDLEEAMEMADPHGLIPEDQREHMIERRREKRQGGD